MVTVAPSSAHTPSEVNTESGTADGKELDAGALFVLKSKGSWLHCGYHLTTAIVAPALLSLPFAMSLLGWEGGVLCLFMGGMVTFYSYNLLSLVLEHYDQIGKRQLRFRDMAHHILGPSWGRYFVGPLQLGICYGAVIANALIGGQSLKYIYLVSIPNGRMQLYEFIIIYGIFALVMAQMPSFHSLRHINLVSLILCLSYCACTTAGAIYIGHSKKAPPRDYSISGVGIDRVFGVFNAISIIATTYGNGIIPEIQATIAAPVSGKMFKGLLLCYSVVISNYFSVGISGYWAFGNQVKGSVLSNFMDGTRPLLPKWFLIITNIFTLLQVTACTLVYQLSIGAACGLSWPADRIIVQVLDDSTDPAIKALVEQECRRWASKGINIKYEIRENRNGYKAGALKEGMKHSYVKLCDYVAIFDADFQPQPDFLCRTIPFLLHNSDIGLVQTRWKFVNSDECMMTRMQEMSLDYHFIVEQEVGSNTYAFFGFNGTAGVWRISALNEAGGWKDRTTVEDMDLAVRASLKGWKFVYVGHVKVKNELPSTFKAYRYQQHRWSCGPANLFRKMAMEIVRNKKVSLWKKFYLLYSFFFVRKIVAHLVTFIFYCLVLPATILVPEVQVPKWGVVYIPSIITLLNAVGTPRSFHLLIFWILFENVMSLHRTKATFIGLFEAGRVNEWIVTEKLGDIKAKLGGSKVSKKPRFRIGERLHILELFVGLYLLFCGWYDMVYGRTRFFIFLFLQSIAFFIAAFGYIGTFVPAS